MKISKFTFRDSVPVKIGEERVVRNNGEEIRGIVTNCVLVRTEFGMDFYDIEVKLNEPIEVSDYEQQCSVSVSYDLK